MHRLNKKRTERWGRSISTGWMLNDRRKRQASGHKLSCLKPFPTNSCLICIAHQPRRLTNHQNSLSNNLYQNSRWQNSCKSSWPQYSNKCWDTSKANISSRRCRTRRSNSVTSTNSFSKDETSNSSNSTKTTSSSCTATCPS